MLNSGPSGAVSVSSSLLLSSAMVVILLADTPVALGDGERAEREALGALEMFGQLPEDERWAAGELGARVDLSTARTLHGVLAGAEDALTPVFANQTATGAINTLAG